MNASDFLGGGPIKNYTQSATLTTSGNIAVPPGTKRIEALLCGGGGGSLATYGGGGFGGLQVWAIPVTGTSLDYVVGAGGNNGIGGTTSVSASGVTYAEVGGGGKGGQNGGIGAGGVGGAGRSGGSGGGAGPGSPTGADGPASAMFPCGTLLWDLAASLGETVKTAFGMGAPGGVKTGGALGVASYGGGGSGSNTGGSLASTTVWGITGYAGAATASGGGGGGMLGAGGTSGGNGGGGAGGGTGATGIGGNGFVAFRFYF